MICRSKAKFPGALHLPRFRDHYPGDPDTGVLFAQNLPYGETTDNNESIRLKLEV